MDGALSPLVLAAAPPIALLVGRELRLGAGGSGGSGPQLELGPPAWASAGGDVVCDGAGIGPVCFACASGCDGGGGPGDEGSGRTKGGGGEVSALDAVPSSLFDDRLTEETADATICWGCVGIATLAAAGTAGAWKLWA